MDVTALRALWRQQSAALGATSYRIQGQQPAEYGGHNINYCRLFDGSERLWSAADVAAAIWRLAKDNEQHFNIYCLPVLSDTAFFLIDDIPGDVGLAAVKAAYGDTAVVLQSSEKDGQPNYQAVFRAAAPGLSLGIPAALSAVRRACNAVMREANAQFGDPCISGVYHQFRMAGFANCKPSRGGYVARLVEVHEGAVSGALSAAVSAEIENMLATMSVRTKMAAAAKTGPATKTTGKTETSGLKTGSSSFNGSAREAEAFRWAWQRRNGLARACGWSADASKTDYHAVKEMLQAGFSEEEAVKGLLSASPDLFQRHSDVKRYAADTVRAALASIEIEEVRR